VAPGCYRGLFSRAV